MFKKITLLLLVGLFVSACDKPASEVAATEQKETSAAADGNFTGVYEGFLPAASGPGIKTQITLKSDGTFLWRSEYVGEENGVFIDQGVYTVAGDVVSFEIPEEGSRYARLEKGALRLLDQDKNVISGNLAQMYVLSQVTE